MARSDAKGAPGALVPANSRKDARRTRRPLDGRRVMLRFVGLVARVPRYLRLGWLLIQEPTVSGRGKAALAGALGYAISPIDPVPGIIPVLGQLDDLAVLLLGVRAALRSAPPELAEQHLKTAGLSHEQLETDLLTIRATTIWVAGRAGAAAARLGKMLLRRVFGSESRVASRESTAR